MDKNLYFHTYIYFILHDLFLFFLYDSYAGTCSLLFITKKLHSPISISLQIWTPRKCETKLVFLFIPLN